MARPIIAFVSTAVCLLSSGHALFAQDLRYDWQPAQSFAYEVSITVDLPDMVETYRGHITYKVKSVDSDNPFE